MSGTAGRNKARPRVLVDTNVLAYLWDPRDQRKKTVATRLISELDERSAGLHSTQTLGELFLVITRKLPVALPAPIGGSAVAYLAEAWPVLSVTPEITLEAVHGVLRYGLPFWDAQLWATALVNGVSIVLSEDFCSGSVLEGVRFANPFERGFDLEVLLGVR